MPVSRLWEYWGLVVGYVIWVCDVMKPRTLTLHVHMSSTEGLQAEQLQGQIEDCAGKKGLVLNWRFWACICSHSCELDQSSC